MVSLFVGIVIGVACGLGGAAIFVRAVVGALRDRRARDRTGDDEDDLTLRLLPAVLVERAIDRQRMPMSIAGPVQNSIVTAHVRARALAQEHLAELQPPSGAAAPVGAGLFVPAEPDKPAES